MKTLWNEVKDLQVEFKKAIRDLKLKAIKGQVTLDDIKRLEKLV